VRTIVRDVKAWGNVLGFSGTNMRYVTITDSQWFNNGLGIVPNALDSEKYAPEEDNVIADNDIFWNNFNYFAGAPFKLRRGSTGSIPYPVGTGVLLFGGRGNIVERNRIYGNYLVGVGAIQQVLLKQADAKDLRNNVVRNNQFGLSGTDKNGRDLFYDGNGTGNCFAANVGVEATVPADGSTFAACPFTGANAFNPAAQQEALNWTISDPTHERFWVKRPHPPKRGITPLEHYERPSASAAAAQRKTVKVGDNFFSPARLTVNRRATVTWKWPSEAGDVHDVKLVSGPKNARRFQSDPASSDFSYRQRLTKPGSYRIVCTLHEDEMKMTIRVRR
jgi:plastocyanin